MPKSTRDRMAHLSDLRHNWPAILGTGAFILILSALVGARHDWVSSVCLITVIVAAWVFEPLSLAIGFVALSLSLPAFSHLAAVSGRLNLPQALVIWLAIATIHLVRLHIALRQTLHLKDAELRAERDEQMEWRTFFDNSPAAILTADGEGRIILGNSAARKLLGLADGPLRGQGIAPSLTALGAALRIDRKDRLFHTLTGCTGWRPNGEMFVADAWFSVGETPMGTRLGAVVVDASERLQERARGGLRSSMATSQIAMGAVLHEIRNLSSAAGLMYANLTNTGAGPFTELHKNADFEALGSLLKALAQLSATELRPGEGSYGSVDLAAVLAQLRIIICPWFDELEMTVEWDIAGDLPQVWGEESGLLQMFLNLAQNSNKAMHASERKQLTIQARLENEWVVVRFLDTGPGVANPDELFEPFRRSTGIRGLGLFVSRAIAHSFCGELRYTPVESGSCFAVELLPLREWQKVAVNYERAPVEN